MSLPDFAIANLHSAGFRLDNEPPGQPPPPPRLTDTFDILWQIADVAAELRCGGYTTVAAVIKEQAKAAARAWTEQQITADEAQQQFELLLARAQQSLGRMRRYLASQHESARLHARATAERWQSENWDDEPERTYPELAALAVRGAG